MYTHASLGAAVRRPHPLPPSLPLSHLLEPCRLYRGKFVGENTICFPQNQQYYAQLTTGKTWQEKNAFLAHFRGRYTCSYSWKNPTWLSLFLAKSNYFLLFSYLVQARCTVFCRARNNHSKCVCTKAKKTFSSLEGMSKYHESQTHTACFH